MELPHKRTILFALSGDVHANASLERAASVASAQGAELEVLRVLPRAAASRDGRISARDAINTLRALSATPSAHARFQRRAPRKSTPSSSSWPRSERGLVSA